jgi:hypothetical protein
MQTLMPSLMKTFRYLFLPEEPEQIMDGLTK